MRNRNSVIIVIYLLFFCGTVFCLASHVSAAVKIVAFGDSITAGVGVPSFSDTQEQGCRCPEEGYEVQLEALMVSKGYRSVEVYNYGISGEETSEGKSRIAGVLASENPDYVLLLEGTNDLSNYEPSTVIDNLSEMIETILNSGATPILATLTPDTRTAGSSKDITGTNELIMNLWSDPKVLSADLYAAVEEDWDDLNSDLLHPNEEGYGVIAETWGTALQQDIINIDLILSGQGTVSSDQLEEDCNSEEDCTSSRVTLPLETVITLTATPADGFVFKGWSGACTDQGRTPVCDLTVEENLIITAMFAKKFYWPLFLPAIMSKNR